jgi:hypothetical protein
VTDKKSAGTAHNPSWSGTTASEWTGSVPAQSTGLTPSTTYAIPAFDAAGNALPAPDTTPPITPANLAANLISAPQINLSWTDSIDNVGVTGYLLERCQNAGCSNFAQIAAPTATNYSDTALVAETSYSYRVRAKDAAGNLSPYSNTATTTTLTAAPTAITFVQMNHRTPFTSQTQVVVPYTLAQTAGNLNIVVVGWNDTAASVISVTDSNKNVYARAVGPTQFAGYATQSIYYAKNIIGAASGANSVTVSFSAGAMRPDIRILEYAGLDTVNPVDVTAGNVGNTANTDSGLVSTRSATELLFGANTVFTSVPGPGSGYIARIVTNPDGNIAEDRPVATIGSYRATAPLNAAGPWIMQLVTFRAPGQLAH